MNAGQPSARPAFIRCTLYVDTPMYQAKYSKDSLIYGSSERVAITTGWTSRETIADHLQPEDYAVIGNLYSPTIGVWQVLANLLSNPEIDALIVYAASDLDATLCSSHALLQALVCGDPVEGISRRWLDELRASVRVYPCGTLKALKEAVRKAKGTHNGLPRPKRLVEPPRPLESTVLPGSPIGFQPKGDSLTDVWLDLTAAILRLGDRRDPVDADELSHVLSVIPFDLPDGDPALLPSQEFLSRYVGQVVSCGNGEVESGYTYGSRLRRDLGLDQIDVMVDRLRKDPFSRRSVATLWNPTEDGDSTAPPCLTQIQAVRSPQGLDLYATFRSHDIGAAYLSNLIALRELLKGVSDELRVAPGRLIVVSQNAHIYDHDKPRITSIISQSKPTRKRFVMDGFGLVLLGVTGDPKRPASLTLLSADGSSPLETHRGTTAKLKKVILERYNHFSPSHLLYLGGELERLKASLKSGTPYRQS